MLRKWNVINLVSEVVLQVLLWPFVMVKSLILALALHWHPLLQVWACEGGKEDRKCKKLFQVWEPVIFSPAYSNLKSTVLLLSLLPRLTCGTYSNYKTQHQNSTTNHTHTHQILASTAHHPPTPHTPTQLDSQQSLTPSYALQLCSFPWLTDAVNSVVFPKRWIFNFLCEKMSIWK